MSIQGAVAAAARKYEPYRGALLALDFRRGEYWCEGRRYREFGHVPGATFSRASTRYKETAAGLLIPVASGVPGITDKGLLVEEARTNLLTYSDTTIANLPSRDQVSDAGSPISGFTNSVAFGDNSVPRYGYKAGAHTNGTTYTLSVFVQMDDGGAPVPRNVNSAGDFGLVIFGNLSTLDPTVTQLGSTTTYRVSVSQVSAGAVTNHGVVKYTGQSARTFKVTGYQFEAGTFPTSYIPTTTASATRAADVATLAYAPTFPISIVGSILPLSSPTAILVQVDDASTNNRVTLFRNTTSANALAVAGGSVEANVSRATVTTNTTYKHAARFATNDVGASLNGGAVGTDTLAAMPTCTRIALGHNSAGGDFANGYIRTVVIYPSAFTDAQLAAATA